MNKHKLGTIGVLAVAALVLSGCTADPLEPDATPEPGGGAADELTSVSIVVAPIQFEMPYIALREGYFAEEGLDVEIIPGGAPTANLARAISGEVDISVASIGTLVTSAAQGIDIVAFAGNTHTSGDHPTSGIITLKSSGIETVADLAGRTLGIQGLNTGSEIAMFFAAEDQGIDPFDIERVELATAGMETALEQGTIDAVLVSAPQYAQIMTRDDVHLVSNPSTEYQAGTPVIVWAATGDWLEQNEETALAFTRAMEKAQTYYENPANLDLILDITAEISQQDRANLSELNLNPASVSIREKETRAQAEAFTRYGIIDADVKFEDIVWEKAPRR